MVLRIKDNVDLKELKNMVLNMIQNINIIFIMKRETHMDMMKFTLKKIGLFS